MYAGFWRRSRARSAEVMTHASDPSDSRQQSKRHMGSAIIRAARYSSIVSGLRISAIGFCSACLRTATAAAPKCSRFTPASTIMRRAMMPI